MIEYEQNNIQIFIPMAPMSSDHIGKYDQKYIEAKQKEERKKEEIRSFAYAPCYGVVHVPIEKNVE